MTETEVLELAKRGKTGAQTLNGHVIDTHISWVILTDDLAYKIKKPIKLSFLDYTSLDLRKGNCEKEIILNSRYSPIYLGVVPVTLNNGEWSLGGEAGDIMDYAVKMKRMDSAKQMDTLLKKSAVSSDSMKPLAELIGSFHNNADMTYHPFSLSESSGLFNDLEQVGALVEFQLGTVFRDIITSSMVWSDQFLVLYQHRLEERVKIGFQRDVHGDLHSGNIFLYDTPILFDGIEFNESFRQIDLLYEVAFLCMELEVHDRYDLSESFLAHYTQAVPCFEIAEDSAIFNYYKCLRANIRAKVHALRSDQTPEDKFNHLQETKKYLQLMEFYMKWNKQLFK
ncbi:hypothetical protein [Anditalea andensis]|uniref:Aminoglycoside phosphotransferase domain-containing protein n=1 Tax=Anditalea andensis TaxID=1048983 RepID=A0A074KUZ9_9BACT|nr:hypothetical protein [Anditalea andensis]KEO73806.1 hypothetical protein EL17_09875 [Anditalea andensis]